MTAKTLTLFQSAAENFADVRFWEFLTELDRARDFVIGEILFGVANDVFFGESGIATYNENFDHFA
jgi:hypothetical protein